MDSKGAFRNTLIKKERKKQGNRLIFNIKSIINLLNPHNIVSPMENEVERGKVEKIFYIFYLSKVVRGLEDWMGRAVWSKMRRIYAAR